MRLLVRISLAQTAVLAGVAAGVARAADPSVELLVETSQVFVREPFQVRVVISNFRECEPFTFPALADCDVEALGAPSESRQISIIGGVRQDWRSRVHTYELTPRRAGTLEIPPIEIHVDGATLRTRAHRLTVRESDAQSLLSVRVACGARRAYVGQQLDLQLEIWIRPARTASGVASALQMWRQVLGRRSTWGPFPIPDKFSSRQREGDGYYVYHSQVRYIADRPGPLNFDDVAIAMEYPVRFGRDIFNDDTPTATRRLRARAEVDPVEVLPLPQDGRPPGFSGAVGRYTLHASASPTTVRVGDPIELTIDVGGEGPLEALPPPVLAQQPALTQAFRVPTEALAGSTQRGQRRFTQVIRAKRSDVAEIPPIEYPYFDPHLGQYVVARSEAIAINVAAAETLSSADLTDGPPAERTGLRPGSEPVDGLRGIEVNPARLLTSAPLVRPAHVLAATVMPPTLFLGTWVGVGLFRRRSNDSAQRRRRAALRRALARLHGVAALPPQQATASVAAALAGYFSDRLNEPETRFTGSAAAQMLAARGVNEQLAAELHTLLERCDAGAYGGMAGDARALAEDAERCLRRLEGEAF